MAGIKRKMDGIEQMPTRTELIYKINAINSSNSANYKRDRAIIALEYLTGARVSELFGDKYKGISGVRMLQIEHKIIRGGDFIVINNVKVLKRKKGILKNIVILIEQEKDFVSFIVDYLVTRKPEDMLFDITRQMAWVIVKKHTGWFNHFFRHLRATHLTSNYGFNAQELRSFFGWAGSEMADNYSHLNMEDLALKMMNKPNIQ